MITEGLVSALVGVLLGLVQPLPTYQVDPGVKADLGTVGAMAGALNGYAPIATVGLGIAVLVAFRLALLTWQGVLFIYHQFWGSS